MISSETETAGGMVERHAAMVDATGRLRPARSGRFPVEAALVTAGAICIPIGLIAIVAGWYGVAHTAYVVEQNSYIISGGILGLGLIFIGCFLYFAYWITRQMRATEVGHQQTLRALSRVETHLAAVSAAVASVPRNGAGPLSAHSMPAAAAGASLVATAPLVATERGSLVHRPDCQIVAHKHNLRHVDRATPGYRPCQVCSPFDPAT